MSMISGSREQIASGIVEFLRRETNFDDKSGISEGTRLAELGLLDSLMMLSLVTFCEERFGCQIQPDDLTEESTESPLALADLVVRVTSRCGA